VCDRTCRRGDLNSCWWRVSLCFVVCVCPGQRPFLAPVRDAL
jgi:hypothetical protein